MLEMNRSYKEAHRYCALSQRAICDLDAAITTMRQAVCYEVPWDTATVDENRALPRELLAAKEAAPASERQGEDSTAEPR